MSTARRAYDLLRGYVNHEWERLRDIDVSQEERELYAELDSPLAQPISQDAPATPTTTVEPKEQARRILGVVDNAPFTDIKQAYDRLRQRSDPKNFPENSAESRQAAIILQRVQWAYGVLTEGMDPTEKRFGSLEIE